MNIATNNIAKTINLGTGASGGNQTDINIGTSASATISNINLYGQTIFGKPVTGSGTVSGFTASLTTQSTIGTGTTGNATGADLYIYSGGASLSNASNTTGTAKSGNVVIDTGSVSTAYFDGSLANGNIQIGNGNASAVTIGKSTTTTTINGILSHPSTTSPIHLNGSAGTTGQVLTSAGAGATPTWTTISGFTGAGTSITGIAGASVSTSGYSSITSPSINFKTGDALGVIYQTPTATSGNINIVTGDSKADNAIVGDVTIGNGAVVDYDGDYGSRALGKIYVGNANTGGVYIYYGGLNVRTSASINSGITTGTAGTTNIGYTNTVATTVNIGSDINTSKVQIWGPLLQNYTVTARNSGTFLYTELLGGVITSATGGATITLPTGANMDNIYSDTSNRGFQWSVINTAASSITIANNGTSHLRVGSGTVAATSSARFMTMRTGLSIWTTYRIS